METTRKNQYELNRMRDADKHMAQLGYDPHLYGNEFDNEGKLVIG